MRGTLLAALLSAAPAGFSASSDSVQDRVAAAVEVTVLDAQRRPVPDAVVYVDAPAESPPPEEPRVMEQRDQELVPHVLVVPAGGKVSFPNRDKVQHNLFSFSKARTFDLDLYRDKPAEPLVFPATGAVQLGCNIHDWMSGVILVVPNAHAAVTDGGGKARLPLPGGPGPFDVLVFHERLLGASEQTRRRLAAGTGKASWRLRLKPDRARKKPKPWATGYGQ